MKKFFSYTSKIAMTAMLSLQINAADLKEIAGDTEMDKLWGERIALDAGERGAWFKEAKYAMFIHWGLYSGLAGDWNGKTNFGKGSIWVSIGVGLGLH